MSNRRCDGIAGQQSRLALATLGIDRQKQSDIEGGYFVQENHEDQTPAEHPDTTKRIPADAEAARVWPEAQWHLDREQAHHDHQPQIKQRASPEPEPDDRDATDHQHRGTDVIGMQPAGTEFFKEPRWHGMTRHNIEQYP